MYKIYLAGPMPISLYNSVIEYKSDMDRHCSMDSPGFNMGKHWRKYLENSLRCEDYQILCPHIPDQYYLTASNISQAAGF